MKCWGSNSSGELGNGTNISSNIPVEVTGTAAGPFTHPLPSIAAGGAHTCAIVLGGKIFCSGANDRGQLGDGTTTDSNVLQPVQRITAATTVAAGNKHTCALQGTAVGCWGDNVSRQLTKHVPLSLSPVPVVIQGVTAIAIAARGDRTCAIEPAGTVKCWGGYVPSVPTLIPGIIASAIAVGRAHACVLDPAGTVKCWGSNYYGQLGDGTQKNSSTPVKIKQTGNAPAIALAAGGDHTCAVFQGGFVECWGRNDFGQTSDGNNQVSSRAPVLVSGLSYATAVALGDSHSCALLNASGVPVPEAVCWGLNDVGQLGNGTNNSSLSPVRVSGLP